MIPVGTKVAVMPNNDCDVRLIGLSDVKKRKIGKG